MDGGHISRNTLHTWLKQSMLMVCQMALAIKQTIKNIQLLGLRWRVGHNIARERERESNGER